MVKGNPYISTNSATMKAENALNERQSRFVCGFAKLKAKMMKIAELMMTSDHNPYAEGSSKCPPKNFRCGLAVILMLPVAPAVTSVRAMKQMQERAKQQKNIR